MRARRALTLGVCMVIAMASGGAAAEKKPAKQLSPAARSKLDLAKGALTQADLSGILAPTPPPTSLPSAPVAATDVRKTYCAKPVTAGSQIERSATASLSGDHASNPGATFSFAYTSTEVYVFPTTASAKQYMTEAGAVMASCTSYYYGTATNDRYVPQRAFSAPKAGDQSALLIATLVFASGNSRDDVFSVVRVGQLISVETLQLSKPLTEPQLDQVARGQAERLSDVLGTSRKKTNKSTKTNR